MEKHLPKSGAVFILLCVYVCVCVMGVCVMGVCVMGVCDRCV